MLSERARRGGCWDSDKHNATNKIVTRQIGRHPEFAIDARGYHCLNTMFMINVAGNSIDPFALLGILNSRLIRAFWLDNFYDRRQTFPKIKGTYLKKLPIAIRGEAATFAKLRDLARRAIHLTTVSERSRSDAHTREVASRELISVEQEIDDLVGTLYRLTDEESTVLKQFVERSAPRDAIEAPSLGEGSVRSSGT